MPQGYPDFFSVPIIPRYGSIQTHDFVVLGIGPAYQVNLIDIEQPATLVDLNLAIYNNTPADYGSITVYGSLDGSPVTGGDFGAIADYLNIVLGNFHLNFSTYGPNTYILRLAGELTIHSQYKLTLQLEGSGYACDIFFSSLWYPIQ